jgi:hypothetical protein
MCAVNRHPGNRVFEDQVMWKREESERIMEPFRWYTKLKDAPEKYVLLYCVGPEETDDRSVEYVARRR